MEARSATSTAPGISTWRSRSGRRSWKTASAAFRRARGSSPIRFRKMSTARRSPKPKRSSVRSKSRGDGSSHDLRGRQLRLLHLEPRPGPGEARPRSRGRSQRPLWSGGGRRGPSLRDRRLAGPGRAEEGGPVARDDRGRGARRDPSAGGLPGTSGDRRAPRRIRGTGRRAPPRKDVPGSPRRLGALRRHPESVRSGAVPFPDRARGRPACRALRHGAQRRRIHHGDRAPLAADLRRAVPSGVGPDARRRETARELHRGGRPRRATGGGPAVTPNVAEALKIVAARRPLSRDLAERVFGDLMDGQATEAQKGAILIGIATRGETSDEIAGAVSALRARMRRVSTSRAPVLDTCGPGGIGRDMFNLSTATAIVAAGAGACVAKHGNRSISSRVGSADVLAAAGVAIDLDPDRAGRLLDEIGLVFLFAPAFHPAMKELGTVRRELGVRTIFNALGPLANPAGAMRQMIGVGRPELVSLLADALAALGSERAVVFHSANGLDELIPGVPASGIEVREGWTRPWRCKPGDVAQATGDAAELA